MVSRVSVACGNATAEGSAPLCKLRRGDRQASSVTALCYPRYVVDSADPESIEQSRHELHELLSKPSLATIPVLVLGNKNDVEGSLKEMDLIDQM